MVVGVVYQSIYLSIYRIHISVLKKKHCQHWAIRKNFYSANKKTFKVKVDFVLHQYFINKDAMEINFASFGHKESRAEKIW